MNDDFTDEDLHPPAGRLWTREDELARMEHRKALAAWPTSQPLGAMHTYNRRQTDGT